MFECELSHLSHLACMINQGRTNLDKKHPIWFVASTIPRSVTGPLHTYVWTALSLVAKVVVVLKVKVVTFAVSIAALLNCASFFH